MKIVVEIEKIQGVERYCIKHQKIYRIPIENFPGHITFIHLIIDGEISLVDLGLDSKKARDDLRKGLEIINRQFNQRVNLKDIKNIIITHGHPDHFGMLKWEKLAGRKIYIHRWDNVLFGRLNGRVDRVFLGIKKFLKESGVEEKLQEEILNEYHSTKHHFEFNRFDYEVIELEDGMEIINGYRIYHTPGHSPGEICLKVDGFLFLGDHILSDITPHQSSTTYMTGVGLTYYFDSLEKIIRLTKENNLYGLPAHEKAVYPVYKRAEAIKEFHYERLAAILKICNEPKNISQTTREYYRFQPEIFNDPAHPVLDKYLAFQEIAAHVEYLLKKGRVEIVGHGESEENEIIKYRAKRV